MKNKVNVLLVDDSAAIISHLKKALEEIKGIDLIHAAGTLPLAQEIIKNEHVDIIVLDIQLPDGNGIDFLKWIKFMRPGTPVIMLSNLADDCHRAAARIAGAEYFFDKSYEFEQVPVTISKIIMARSK